MRNETAVATPLELTYSYHKNISKITFKVLRQTGTDVNPADNLLDKQDPDVAGAILLDTFSRERYLISLWRLSVTTYSFFSHNIVDSSDGTCACSFLDPWLAGSQVKGVSKQGVLEIYSDRLTVARTFAEATNVGT
jgi:hypothetical protein